MNQQDTGSDIVKFLTLRQGHRVVSVGIEDASSIDMSDIASDEGSAFYAEAAADLSLIVEEVTSKLCEPDVPVTTGEHTDL